LTTDLKVANKRVNHQYHRIVTTLLTKTFVGCIFRSKAGKLDLMKEYEKRKASNDKENLNMVVIGEWTCL